MSDAAGLDFLVNKTDWKQHRFDENPQPEIGPGQVCFRVDRFAVTANNVSYALTGDMIGYWRFFPAPDGWGRVPAMGFADVSASKHPDVAVGTRCFGFYPMSRFLVIEPSQATASSIVDGAKHREGLAPVYAQYVPTGGDALYHAEHEDALMLMRGLFMTSFLADDFIADRAFGDEAVLISSASSKTSIALGYQVNRGGRATRGRPHFPAQPRVRAEARLLRRGAHLRRSDHARRAAAERLRRHGRQPRAPQDDPRTLRRPAEALVDHRRHALGPGRRERRPRRGRSPSSSSRRARCRSAPATGARTKCSAASPRRGPASSVSARAGSR